MEKLLLIAIVLIISLTTYGQQWNGDSNSDDFIWRNGNIEIGTRTPGCKLNVAGIARAKEIRVEIDGADFVFEDNYNLRSLRGL